MPAFTIAAACRYALTGVEAAMASGSQKWKGNWADFVMAATATRTAMVAVKAESVCQMLSAKITPSEVDPVRAHMSATAASSAKPPAAVTINERSAGRVARGPSRAMRKNEQIVVASQKA